MIKNVTKSRKTNQPVNKLCFLLYKKQYLLKNKPHLITISELEAPPVLLGEKRYNDKSTFKGKETHKQKPLPLTTRAHQLSPNRQYPPQHTVVTPLPTRISTTFSSSLYALERTSAITLSLPILCFRSKL